MYCYKLLYSELCVIIEVISDMTSDDDCDEEVPVDEPRNSPEHVEILLTSKFICASLSKGPS